MFYEPGRSPSGLPFNPFKACCVPRPIGWVSTTARDGVHNLAPYSQFQNVSYDPPMIMIAAQCRADGTPKDTVRNALDTGELVWNMATYDLRAEVVGSSRDLPPEVDEFAHLGIPSLPSRLVKPLRVAASPVQFECRLKQSLYLPCNTPEANTWMLIAEVVGVHIDEAALTPDGRIDTARIRPLARLGYRDYTYVDKSFELSEFTGRADAAVAFLAESAEGQ